MKRNYRTDYPRWYGIYGVEFIWKGEWSDPYIRFRDYVMNSHDVEDAMWEEYNEYLEENGIENQENEDELFSKYMKENAYRVKELCQYCIENGMAKRIVPNSIRKVFAPFEPDGWVKKFDVA
jgi:hypothetical protein